MSELEAPVDLKPEIDAKCLESKCQHEVHEYKACIKRIEHVNIMKEPHCWGTYMHLVHCVDVCTHPILWPTLK